MCTLSFRGVLAPPVCAVSSVGFSQLGGWWLQWPQLLLCEPRERQQVSWALYGWFLLYPKTRYMQKPSEDECEKPTMAGGRTCWYGETTIQQMRDDTGVRQHDATQTKSSELVQKPSN